MPIGPKFTLLYTLSLGSTPSENVQAPTSVEPDVNDDVAYARALAALDEAVIVASTDPEQGIVLLNRALETLHQFAPVLATDRTARSRRSLAHLALARAKLSLGDEQGAEASVDATLRELGDLELSIEALGPTLGRLVEARRTTLEGLGQGRVRVVCATPCRAWIDEHDADAALGPEGLVVWAGTHRAWIEDPRGQLDRQRREFEVRSGESIELHYPSVAPPPELAVPPERSDARPIDHRPRRLAPRWAELLGAGLGLAGLASGAALWAIDSTCPGGASPRDVEACPSLYDTRGVGIASVALGSALVVTSVVLLTVDERRVRRARATPTHSLALRWGPP